MDDRRLVQFNLRMIHLRDFHHHFLRGLRHVVILLLIPAAVPLSVTNVLPLRSIGDV